MTQPCERGRGMRVVVSIVSPVSVTVTPFLLSSRALVAVGDECAIPLPRMPDGDDLVSECVAWASGGGVMVRNENWNLDTDTHLPCSSPSRTPAPVTRCANRNPRV